ncbi:SusC/RagA family TonB-linked outer membrane protein [Pedobacter yulinensis]|uniref:SusC/RagA family TonB-linked outer membrane protein n=1 Tax=Pedobacter yulinensis TaxID=2126353 RepID=A0A2T3HPZ7_9SPHI|nr:SusC/RagA family TonB-linked outer membrane protein [Pedobacter yulinensis]PST84535.1 SusC/RagA family TonB-linked outer membrane protein [Pedobacter yulinensis]
MKRILPETAGRHKLRLFAKARTAFVIGLLAFTQVNPLLAAISATPLPVQAQQTVTVRGRVVDDADNTGIPGVTIMDANKKVYGATNNDGDFAVIVPQGTTLTFNMLGYTSLSRLARENASGLSIRLKASSNTLSDVVVTALGIKREERSLGYAANKLDSNEFTNAVASNWTDALSGKVAGLNLVRNSGPAGSNKIILRGENNLTGDNEALIVIDGVVASSSARRSAATGGGVYGTSGDIMPADFGSGLNDLNPDDIDNVTVLKGPAASALYGQRGANGAIIITTKSAKLNKKKLGITFTSNSTWEEVNRGPERQQEYGAGVYGNSYFSYGTSPDGPSTNATSSTWGPPFSLGSMFYQFDPATKARGVDRTPWMAYEDPVNAFFVTGYESANSVSLDGTYKKVGLRLSASHGENEWIVPNTGLERTNVALNVNTNLTKKLSVNLKAQYSNRNSDNLPATGYGNQSLMYWFMFAQPNVNVDWYRDYWVPGREFQQFVNITTTNPESPYAISEQYLNGQRRNGWLGNASATYKFSKELSLMLRATMDLNKDIRETRRPWDASGNKFAQGSFRVANIRSYEINADFMLRYDKKINKNLRVNASVGGSQMRNSYNRLETRADGLIVPNLYSLDNNRSPLIYAPDTARYRINSFYATASFDYRNLLYLDLTARQDWNSTLATITRTDNVGFFYPSASLAFIASDLWKLPKAINYAKLRASIAQVGSGSTVPYRTEYNYLWAADGIYPDGALNNTRILPNPNLKPLITTTVELGLDLKLFKDRLTFDLAAYAGNTKNQILNRIVDKSTGYNVQVVNIGRVDNKGLELAVNGTPVKTRSFSWTVFGTFTANRNKIKELADSSLVLRTGALGSGQVVANVGGSMGDMYGRGYLRAPDGQIVYNPTTGVALENPELIYLGNTLPDFRFSMGTGFSYKQFSLNALFDAQLGAVGHSLTFSRMASLGKHVVTLPGRYNGVIGDGVVQNADGTYRKNDVIATDIAAYYESIYGSGQAEGSVFRTDYLKFREASFTYAFNKRFLTRIGFNKMTLGVYGRNLFIWSPWPAFDPEFGTLAGSDITQGFETGQLPSTRTYGVRLVVGL